MDNGSFDPYIHYVQSLHRTGMTVQGIQQDLLGKGFNPETANWLLRTAVPEAAAVAAPTAAAPVTSPAGVATAGPPGAVPVQATQPSWSQRALQPAPVKLRTHGHQAPAPSMWKGYMLALLLCLLPTLLIMFDEPFSMRFGTTIRSLLTWSDILGMVGLVLYVLDLVLATRLSWLEDLFGGLNKVYIAHAIFGGAALVAILIHPILFALRFLPLGMTTVAGTLMPSMEHIGTAYGIVALIITFVLLILTLYVRLPYRLWLTTHKWLGLAYVFVCAHILFQENAITNNAVMRWYVITLLIVGGLAYVYRTLLPNILVRRYTYVISAVKQKTTGVMEITLRPTNKVMRFEAGQFVFISFHADGLSPEWHPFTIASAPADGSFAIEVKSLGGYTETMTRLLPGMVGMTASIEGAYGRFSFRNFRNVNQVWIAGGIGIAPFLSMAQSLGNRPYNIDLYYSVKSEAELIDIDVLARQQAARPGQVFRVIPFITDKYKQHLTADIIQATTGDLKRRDVLICGPDAMMADITKQLRAKGVKKYRIHDEEFAII